MLHTSSFTTSYFTLAIAILHPFLFLQRPTHRHPADSQSLWILLEFSFMGFSLSVLVAFILVLNYKFRLPHTDRLSSSKRAPRLRALPECLLRKYWLLSWPACYKWESQMSGPDEREKWEPNEWKIFENLSIQGVQSLNFSQLKLALQELFENTFQFKKAVGSAFVCQTGGHAKQSTENRGAGQRGSQFLTYRHRVWL